jgi:diketogulonate reductase-like aldo/keto reductase
VIIGATTAEQLADNLGASKLELSAEDLNILDEVSVLPPEYPGWMLARQGQSRATSPQKI